MEIDEVAARLVRQYWMLLVACMLVPILIVVVIVAQQPAMYAADARIITSSEVPVTASEADAIVSQVQGIATGPTSVSQALQSAGIPVSQDAAVARHVSVVGLGTSQVVDITVTDRNPRIAQLAARLMAAQVVDSLNKVGQSGLSEALAAIDSEIVRLTEQRSVLAAEIASSPGNQTNQAKLAGLDQVIANFTGDRSRLLIQASTQGLATVLDNPGLPTSPESKALLQKLGLALLLGLVLGILLAAIAEMIRPTVPGARRVGRRLRTPMLGSLTELDLRGERTPAADSLVLPLRLAAEHGEVTSLALVDIDAERRLEPLADILTSGLARTLPAPDGATAPSAGQNGASPPTGGSASPSGTSTVIAGVRPVIDKRAPRVATLQQLQRQLPAGRIGIVVLCGPVARVSRVSVLDDLSVASGWPIIGVVGVPPLRRKPRVRK